MTSMISRAKESAWFQHYAYHCKRNSRLWIVLAILSALGYPLVFLVALSESTFGMLGAVGVMSQLAACASGIFLVYNSFDYLYNKSLVDMAFSAPLTTTQRFWSHFSSGLTVYLTPYLGSSIIGILIVAMGNLSGKTVFTGQIPTILQMMVMVFIAMVMLYALTLLVVVSCGKLFESVAYTLVINAVIPVTIAVTLFIVLEDIFGINIEQAAIDLLSVSSPFGVAFGTFGTFMFGVSMSGYETFIWHWRYILPILLITAGLIALSFVLYKRRKAEHTGRPFVFKLMYYVLLTGVTYSIIAALLSMHDVEAFVAALIVSGIIYLIAEVITNRGFRKFGWSVLRYVCTVVGSVIIVATLQGTELFGLPYRIPSQSSVNAVSVNYEGYYGNYGLPWYNGNLYTPFDAQGSTRFTEQEDIETILALHKTVLDRYEEGTLDTNYYETMEYGNSYYISGQTLELDYHRNFGLDMSRQYYLQTDLLDMLKSLDSSPAYREVVADHALQYYENAITLSLSNIYYGEEKFIYGAGENYGIDKMVLAQKIRQDIMEESEEDYFNPQAAPVCTLHYEWKQSEVFSGTRALYIKASFTNTLEYLREKGLGSYIDQQASNASLPDELYGLYLFEPLTSDTKNYTDYYGMDLYHVTLNYFETPYAETSDNTKRLIISDEVRELLSVAQPVYRSDEACYVIGNEYTGETLLIPPQFADLAEKVFNSEDAVDLTEGNALTLEEFEKMGIKLTWDEDMQAYTYYDEEMMTQVYVEENGARFMIESNQRIYFDEYFYE